MAKNSKKAKELDKNQTISVFSSFYGNPIIQTKNGRTKPSVYTPRELRSLSMNNNIVRICINYIKHQVVKSKYVVRAKDPKRHEEFTKEIDYLYKLFQYPNDTDDTSRTLFSKLVEDLLVLDFAVIEKVRNKDGWITDLYSVDGSTIRPVVNDYGVLEDIAYKQFLDFGQVEPVAEFKQDELLVFQINPQVVAGFTGYGMSPVESVINTVVNQLMAMQFNASYFDETKIPQYMANLKGMPVETIKKFKQEFDAQLLNKNWAGAWTNAESLDFKLLRPSNVDMQFNELNLWLARVIFGAFEIAPQNLGFTMDVNRATAEVQDDITRDGGVANVLDVIKEEVNNDIIGDLALVNSKFGEIEFDWEDTTKKDLRSQADIDEIYLRNKVLSGNEVRERMGLDPVDWAEQSSADEAVGTGFEFATSKSNKLNGKPSWENW